MPQSQADRILRSFAHELKAGAKLQLRRHGQRDWSLYRTGSDFLAAPMGLKDALVATEEFRIFAEPEEDLRDYVAGGCDFVETEILSRPYLRELYEAALPAGVSVDELVATHPEVAFYD